MVTAAQLRQVMPLAGAHAGTYAPLLSDMMARYQIDTPRRTAALLSQIAVESGQLGTVVESFNYRDPARLFKIFPHDFASLADAVAVHARGQEAIANRVYAKQDGNGDEASGDGWRFRGHGLPQLTGRGTFAACAEALGLDLLAHPELLSIPKNAADAAGFFWQWKKVAPLADAGDISAVSKRWNGGFNGFPLRVMFYQRALKI